MKAIIKENKNLVQWLDIGQFRQNIHVKVKPYQIEITIWVKLDSTNLTILSHFIPSNLSVPLFDPTQTIHIQTCTNFNS